MIFHNYETSKLLISDVTYNNILIISLFAVLSLLSFKKSPGQFLDHAQTNQLKGFAIIMVVLGHLWVHVSQDRAFPIYGSYSVALFLFLSGFGLTLSCFKKKLDFKEFCIRRLSRVMIPYWGVTLLILFCDRIFLDKSYSINMSTLTLLGINVDKTLRSIDYTRWFITLLLVYYLLFFWANHYFKKKTAVMFLLCSSPVLFVLNWLGYFPIGALFQYVAFPLGCLTAIYKNEIASFLVGRSRYIRLVALLAAMAIVSYLISLYCNASDDTMVFDASSKIMNLLLRTIQATLLYLMPFLVIGLVGQKGYKSSFLEFCGTISYELYLIHGVLLIKYNPIIELLDTKYIAVSFMALFALLVGLSKLLNIVSSYIVAIIQATQTLEVSS